MTNADILTEIDGPVARITFNRPEARNALTAEMLATMREFLKRIEHDPAVRCVLLTGTGDHFMAGGDVAGFGRALESTPEERRRDFEERARGGLSIFTTVERMAKPIVAKVRGAAAGGSLGWIAAADFVVASETAIFVFAHIHLGASADGGVTWYLPRIIGLRQAKELLLLGGKISASEALALGLVNRVVADGDLDAETDALVARLVAGPAYAIGRMKLLLNEAAGNDRARQMDLEAQALGDCAATDDFTEGVRSFMEKRRASFGGG